MSADKLSSLLDEMLDDSAIEQAAREVEAKEAQARAAQQRASQAPAQSPAQAPPALDDVSQLTGLPDGDLRAILAAAAPDDILVVLAAGDEAIQRRVLRNLGAESVQWIRDNLAHMGEVNEHEAGAARGKLLAVANRLLAAGEIHRPDPASVGTSEAPDAERLGLRELLTDLVRIADQAGPAALAEVAEGAGEPLLREGLSRVIEGQRGDALRETLAELRGELERRYAQRLRWMVEALVAVADGEDADSFAQRVFK